MNFICSSKENSIFNKVYICIILYFLVNANSQVFAADDCKPQAHGSQCQNVNFTCSYDSRGWCISHCRGTCAPKGGYCWIECSCDNQATCPECDEPPDDEDTPGPPPPPPDTFTPTFTPTSTPTPTPTPCTGDIGGYVWNDVNMNGVWENETEPGVNDIHVLLLDGEGSSILPSTCVLGSTDNRLASGYQCGYWPVSITGGDPRQGVEIPAGNPYYAGGINPGYMRYEHIWNPVVEANAPAEQIAAIRKRLPDLQPRPDIDFTNKYLYSRFSGYWEFQNLALGTYRVRVLTSIWQQENWGMYKIDNRFYFPYPRPLQFTAPEYRELDITLLHCGTVMRMPNIQAN